MAFLLDEISWRETLARTGAEPDAVALLATAEMCEAAGLADAARTLFATAAILQGFSRQAIAGRAALAERLGMSETPPATVPSGTDTVEIAIGDLKAFAEACGGKAPATAAPEPDADDLPGALHAWLSAPASGAQGAALLEQLRRLVPRVQGLEPSSFRAAPLRLLASTLVLIGLRTFATTNHELLFGPLGGADAVHRAARFDSHALGPYFGNVGRVAGNSRDVFELARIARQAGLEAGHEPAPAAWVLLLSQHLAGALRDELVDDLGDLGAMPALAGIIDHAARRPRGKLDLPLVGRVRDAALDNGDTDLAARAQMLIVQQRPDSLLERQILGLIDATGGRIAAAEQSFLACLLLAEEDAQSLAYLEALRTSAFAPFALKKGYGSPPDRLAARLRRRAGPPQRVVQEDRPRSAVVEFYGHAPG